MGEEYLKHSRAAILSVPQIVYPLGGSSKNSSHVYFLLQVFWVVLLFDINVVLMLPWWPDVTIVQSDVTIVVPWQLSTGSIHDYICWYGPLVGAIFVVMRIDCALCKMLIWKYKDPPAVEKCWEWHMRMPQECMCAISMYTSSTLVVWQ